MAPSSALVETPRDNGQQPADFGYVFAIHWFRSTLPRGKAGVLRSKAGRRTARGHQNRAPGLRAFAFTVWTIFSIIGVKIKAEPGLSDARFGLPVATPAPTGSISRIFLGVWTEQFGRRIMFPPQMLLTAA